MNKCTECNKISAVIKYLSMNQKTCVKCLTKKKKLILKLKAIKPIDYPLGSNLVGAMYYANAQKGAAWSDYVYQHFYGGVLN